MNKKSNNINVKELLHEKEALEKKIKEISINLPFSEELKQYSNHIFDYYNNNGNLNIPMREKTSDDLPLGKFVYFKLRPRFRRWKSLKDTTSNSQSFWNIIYDSPDIETDIFNKLDKLGFSTTLNRTNEWDLGYRQLEKYFNENGHSYVKPGYEHGAEKYPLGTWVTYQRTLKKNKKLNSTKINKLNHLNFLWVVDLGSILLDRSNANQSVLETQINLKRTFDHLASNESNVSLNVYKKDRDEFIDLSAKLLEKQKEKIRADYQIRELQSIGRRARTKVANSEKERENLDNFLKTLEMRKARFEKLMSKTNEKILKMEKDSESLSTNIDAKIMKLGRVVNTRRLSPKIRKLISYGEAKKYAQRLQLTSQADWRKHVSQENIPDGIPNNPDSSYRDVWTGWAEFLGFDK